MIDLTSQGARLNALRDDIKKGLDRIDETYPTASNDWRAGFLSGYLAHLMHRIGMAYESKGDE